MTRSAARLALCLSLALGGCALLAPLPPPLGPQEIVRLARAGEPPAAIIRKIDDTRTLIPLTASDILRLHEAGVPGQVLDHLQRLQLDAVRQRAAAACAFYGHPPFGPAWGCPLPLPRLYPYGWLYGPYPLLR